MTDEMRAALEAAKENLLFAIEQLVDDCDDDVKKDFRDNVQQIDEALKSEPKSVDIRLVEGLIRQAYDKGISSHINNLTVELMHLPEAIEKNADAVLNLQVEMCKQEREIELLQAENAYEVFTNPDYKHDTVRNAKLVMSLQTSGAYYEKQKALDRTKILLQRARIAYQRSRDTFDAYRSIAAMGAKA